VSGQHYFKALPKSDVWVILAVVIFLVSWFLRHVQYSKYERAVKYLKVATIHKLSLQDGGSPQTLELYSRAVALYDTKMKEGTNIFAALCGLQMCVTQFMYDFRETKR
jgi:hypothetical protein